MTRLAQRPQLQVPSYRDAKGLEAALAQIAAQAITGHLPYREVTADTTLTGDDVVLYVDASAAGVTVTLPPAAGHGRRVLIVMKVDASANTVTVDGNGAETINGAATVTVFMQWTVLVFHCVENGWRILANG